MAMLEIKDGQVSKMGLWTGTVIKMRDGKRFKVTKLNPVNVKMLGEDGKTYTYNRDAAERDIDENQEWDGPKEKDPYELYLEAREAGITLGTQVRLKESRLSNKYGAGIFVVCATKSDGTFRIAKLGGDGGRYLRGMTAAQLEVVPVD